jgi:hypothetical protein
LGPAPPPPQVFGATQVSAHVTEIPQLLVVEPQALPMQAATLFAVQPHELGPPLPAPQVFTPVHVLGQVMAVPQLLVAGPQALPAQAAVLLGTHWHWVAPLAPTQVSLEAHGAHLAASSHPLFASVGTHLSPHFLVPGAHVPMTHAVPWHTSVPEPAAGQAVASHVVAPHPYVGSLSATHLLPHFLVPEGQVAMTHAVPMHVTVPPAPGLGHPVASHVVAPHP